MNFPNSPDAEEALLGVCLRSSEAVEWTAKNILVPDFYIPSHQYAYNAILDLYNIGAAIDELTVYERMASVGTLTEHTRLDLSEFQSNAPAISSYKRYGEIVAEHSLRRNMITLGLSLADDAGIETNDASKLLERLSSDIKAIDSPVIVRDPGDIDIDDFLEEPDELDSDMVIPGILGRDWRIMFVAPEGVGKSVLERQLAICARYGVHPFTHQDIEPRRVLIVDLENPKKPIKTTLGPLTQLCRERGPWEDGTGRLWRRPEGIDLRSRADRTEFEDVLRRHQPDLVVLGPLYKTYNRGAKDSYEEIAAGVEGTLDDLRTRYNFGLIVEHHAPKDRSFGMTPEGSSLWMRWPELGLQLIPPSRKFPVELLNISPFRGDRVEHQWPDVIHWGKSFPWEAKSWPTGTFRKA